MTDLTILSSALNAVANDLDRAANEPDNDKGGLIYCKRAVLDAAYMLSRIIEQQKEGKGNG